ncbi:MAG: NUDIX domain-containing protein [Patescibacteria group bacterium]
MTFENGNKSAMFDKVGLATVRDGRLLLCRPHAYEDLILPGGIRENGEDDIACLRREVAEELGPEVYLEDASLAFFGEFDDIAGGPAGVHGKRVNIRLYRGTLVGTPRASDEIRDLIWYQPGGQVTPHAQPKLSPIVRNKIIPALVAAGVVVDGAEASETS